MSETSVSRHGPLFDGRAIAALYEYAHRVRDELGKVAVSRVRVDLSGVLRTNTGRYESKIHVEVGDSNELIVTDTIISYGPWLEGVGSRNATTRFKGYHTFRFVAQDLKADAQDIAERFFVDGGYEERING